MYTINHWSDKYKSEVIQLIAHNVFSINSEFIQFNMLTAVQLVVTLINVQTVLIVFGSDEYLDSDNDFKENSFDRILEDLHQEPVQELNSKSRVTVNTAWITQKLDHFNESDKRTWQMRYKSNEMHFQNGGPIFIFIGAEWEITDGPLKDGPMYRMAKNMNGYMFYTEHRYYGQSHPTKDLSTSNLRHLKLEQSLADLAHFIKTMKKSIEGLSESKIILVGGSLSASMVTWFRRIYPDLAVGGWASSAPVKFQVDFYEYKEVVGEALQSVGGAKCYARVENAFKAINEAIKKNDRNVLFKVLKLCSSFNPGDKNDVRLLFLMLADMFGGAVQTHVQGKIESYCNKILSENDDIKGVAGWMHEKLKLKSCWSISYKNFIKQLKRVDWKYSKFSRQWFYQTCNQFGWFHTFNSDDQPFGKRVPIEYYEKFCSDLFGKEYTIEAMQARVEEMNTVYEGLELNVKNMYYTHGYLDPWRPMGIQENVSYVKILKGHSHCNDLKIRETDTEEMILVRKDIVDHVYKWLELKNDNNTRTKK